MKRQYRKSNIKARKDSSDAGHLDETITQLTSSTHTALQRYWKIIAMGFGMACLIIVCIQVLDAMASTKEESLHARLYRLTLAKDARDTSALPDLKGLARLTREVQGTPAEKIVLMQTVAFLLQRANSFADEARRQADFPADPESVSEPESNPNPQESYDQIVTVTREMTTEAQKTLRDDREFDKWANDVLNKIDKDTNKNWLPPKPKYQLQPPDTLSESSGGDNESPQ